MREQAARRHDDAAKQQGIADASQAAIRRALVSDAALARDIRQSFALISAAAALPRAAARYAPPRWPPAHDTPAPIILAPLLDAGTTGGRLCDGLVIAGPPRASFGALRAKYRARTGSMIGRLTAARRRLMIDCVFTLQDAFREAAAQRKMMTPSPIDGEDTMRSRPSLLRLGALMNTGVNFYISR